MKPIHPKVTIGHVHLKVADLDRAIAFYSGVLGLKVQQLYGPQAAFLSADDYHHHVGLNTWHSQGGSPAPSGHTGLYHVAFLYPNREELADAIRRVMKAGIKINAFMNHGVSEAAYIDDPDGNGVELYYDYPKEKWPRNDKGELEMIAEPIDLEKFLSEVPEVS